METHAQGSAARLGLDCAAETDTARQGHGWGFPEARRKQGRESVSRCQGKGQLVQRPRGSCLGALGRGRTKWVGGGLRRPEAATGQRRGMNILQRQGWERTTPQGAARVQDGGKSPGWRPGPGLGGRVETVRPEGTVVLRQSQRDSLMDSTRGQEKKGISPDHKLAVCTARGVHCCGKDGLGGAGSGPGQV